MPIHVPSHEGVREVSADADACNILCAQVQLLGQSISVGRPSGYVDPSRAQEAAAAAAAALQAFQVCTAPLQSPSCVMHCQTFWRSL